MASLPDLLTCDLCNHSQETNKNLTVTWYERYGMFACSDCMKAIKLMTPVINDWNNAELRKPSNRFRNICNNIIIGHLTAAMSATVTVGLIYIIKGIKTLIRDM